MQDKNIELMEKAPIPKAILSLALPTVFSSIVISFLPSLAGQPGSYGRHVCH